MKNIDRKIEEIKTLQAELDYRTKVENEAIKLISECRKQKLKSRNSPQGLSG